MTISDPTKPAYTAKAQPTLLNIPAGWFAAIAGQGDPNGEGFGLATAALFSLSYAIKMSYKSSAVPDGYYTYKVFPLEADWDLVDKTRPISDKDNYQYQVMIRQPGFLNPELFQRFYSEVVRKKPTPPWRTYN